MSSSPTTSYTHPSYLLSISVCIAVVDASFYISHLLQASGATETKSSPLPIRLKVMSTTQQLDRTLLLKTW